MRQRTIAPFVLGSAFLGLGLLILVIGLPFGFSRGPSGPRLVFAQPEVDYGDVPVEQMVTHYFEFTNQGDAPLSIDAEPAVETVAGC